MLFNDLDAIAVHRRDAAGNAHATERMIGQML